MTTSNTVFRTTELDFDTIKANLKDFLRNQNTFQDYDFEGSAMNILLDLLAYNTHYMGYYQNMLGNESFLDSAVMRDSIVSLAKHLGYTPSSRRAAVANVNITITPPGGNTLSSIIIPKYTTFQSEAIDGENFTFITLGSYSATKNNLSNTFTFPSVELKQGEYVKSSFLVDTTTPQKRYIIPNANVDSTSIAVTIQASTVDNSTKVWNEAEDLTELDANSEVYFVEARNSNLYALYFGDGYLGKALSNGNIIISEYIVTEGTNSNKANVFTAMDTISGFSNVSITTNGSAAGGSEAETDNEIKHRAPIAYTAQNRAVTIVDYENVLGHDYPNVDQISVWGGEDNDPVIYGKVFISMKPKAGYVLTNSEKDRIITEILANRNMITVTPEIVDPIYTYLLAKVKVYYDASLTTLTGDELSSLVRTNVLSYTQNQLGGFNEPFRSSKLQAVIDNSENSILNSDLETTLQKRFLPTLGTSKNYEGNFNTEIKRGSPEEKVFSYPVFTINDSTGVARDAYLEEVPFSYTGVESIDVTNPGNGYTTTPIVTITGDGTGATAVATVINGKISTITVVDRGSDYSRAFITIAGGNGQDAIASPVLSTKFGSLRSFYYKSTGEKVILNTNVGTINYSTGKITLINFSPTTIAVNPVYDTGILVINATPAAQTITPSRNNIIILDEGDPLSIIVETIPV